MRKKGEGRKEGPGRRRWGRKGRTCVATLLYPKEKVFALFKSRLRGWFLAKILAYGPGQEYNLLAVRI